MKRLLEKVKFIWSNPIVKVIIFIIAVIVPFGVTVLAILNGGSIKEKLIGVLKRAQNKEPE